MNVVNRILLYLVAFLIFNGSIFASENATRVPTWMYSAIKHRDNQRVMEWLERNSANKNAIVEYQGLSFPMLTLCCRLGNVQIIDYLITRDVHLGDGLKSFIEYSENFNKDQINRLLPKFIDLAIKQHVSLEALLKDAQENKQRIVHPLEERMKRVKHSYLVNEIKETNKKVEVAEIFIKNINDAIESFRYQNAYDTLAEEDLVSKDVAAKNIKEFFELPQGNQATVHKMKQAIREGDTKVLGELLNENKNNIELADERGYTPLLQAVYTNKIPIVMFLKSKGANVNATIIAADGKSVNSFELAVMLGYKDMAQLLASYGLGDYKPVFDGDINQRFTHLMAAIKNNETKEAEEFLNIQTANMKDADGKTPLMMAALKGNKELAKAILDMVPDIKPQDKNGNTALHWAVINRNYEIALLLINGCPNDGFIVNKKGLTAITLAENDLNSQNTEAYKLFMRAAIKL